MNKIIKGAIVNDTIIEVLKTLQTFHELRKTYISTLNTLITLHLTGVIYEMDESETLPLIRTLAYIKQDLIKLGCAAASDDEACTLEDASDPDDNNL